MSSKTISLKRLVSQCVDLAERAGHHIRTVSGKLETSGSLQMHDKGLGTGVFDPQTIADRQAQRCIVENLRAVYGMDLHVVGEEGELGVEEEGEDIVIREPMEDLLDGEWSEASDLHLPISELCVWVDPLDGTREFTEQRYEYVSTLIGISRQNRPVAGVISEPYPQPGRILWGCCQAPSNQPAPGVHVYGSPDWSRPARDPPSRCLAILSRSRAGGVVEEALERLSEPGTGEGPPLSQQDTVSAPLITGRCQAGGAGHKVARVVDGAADLWLFPRPGTSRWDTCAAEAMLEASGGALRNMYGEQICYDPDGAMGNTEGVLAAASPSIVSAAVRVCSTLDLARNAHGGPLTRQWLEEALQLRSGSLAAFAVEPYSDPDGRGTSSFRLILRYARDVLVDEELGPLSVCLSRSSAEAQFFECAERLSVLSSVKLPKIFYNEVSQADPESSVLLMEDFPHLLPLSSLADLKMAVSTLARFHAASFAKVSMIEGLKGLEKPVAVQSVQTLEELGEAWKVSERKELASRLLAHQSLFDALPIGLEKTCIIHGDARTENISINRKTSEVILRNFQHWTVGCPATDLAYFLCSAPEAESWDELLNVYWSSFTASQDHPDQMSAEDFRSFVRVSCFQCALFASDRLGLDSQWKALEKFLQSLLEEVETA
ncbi:3'(2') [Durusdinium trenchii]|uniref:3'(2'),5'-bisphosphate nucleotidase 1 n=1 Tax=Durusdinium trenchii TaxID=1381693 RepID=A0ABP0PA68_9DINO